jgi:hypothetical protein
LQALAILMEGGEEKNWTKVEAQIEIESREGERV